MKIKLGFLISLAILALVISLLHAFNYVNFGYVPLPDMSENYGRLVSDMVHENDNQRRRWIITSISFMVFLASGVFTALCMKQGAVMKIALTLIGIFAVSIGVFIMIFHDSIFADVAVHHKPVSIGKLNPEER